MIKTCILIALLLQLFYTLIQGHESPCPQYFKYKIKSGTDETIGEINIQSPPRSGTLHLKVILKIPAALHTKYVGRLELARSAEKSAKAVQQGRNLLYNLHFPLRQPIPILFKMWFNDEQYCSGSDIKGSYVTTITLQHTFYLPNVQNSKTTSKSTQSKKKRVNLSQGIGNNIFLNRIPSQSTSLYNNVFLNPISSQLTPGHSNNNNNIFLQPSAANPTAQNNNNNNSWDNIFLSSSVNPILQNNSSNNNNNNSKNNCNNNNNNINKNYNECGVSGRTGNTNLLIANGQETMPGQWPWLVAIFVVRQEYKFQCAGSVLTTRHVITAAHCMMLHSNSNVTLHPNVLEVALGRFNLHRFRERGTVNREVASYKIHPDYLYGNNADSDLAILVLRTPVKFSSFIRPICLWSQSTDLQTVVNRVGYVVGWGQDEHGYFTEEPRLTFMPIVTQDTCHWSHESFIFFTSNRTFCAGMRNGSGPCNGDSGSGLVLFDATTSRYQLRGIVSRSIFGGDSPCDFTKFTIFVDAAKYSPWIQEQIST